VPRPRKSTVDYFPHYVTQGKTLLILENEFGNDGYAFWFKLLELLCCTEGQAYDYNNPASWRLLLVKTRVKEETANQILSILSELGAIDHELYKNKVIWVQNLVDNLELVYKKRSKGMPEKPEGRGMPLFDGMVMPESTIPATEMGDTVSEMGDSAENIIPLPPIPPIPLKQYNTKQNETIVSAVEIVVFNIWNSKNIIVHKKLNYEMKRAIDRALNEHSSEEITQAIDNYAEILKGEQYYFKYSWTLKDFLRRGLEKFLDLEVAKNNYRRDRSGTDKKDSTKLPDRRKYTKPEDY